MFLKQSLFAGIPKTAGSIDSNIYHSTFNQPHSIAQITPTQFIISDCKNDILRLINTQSQIVQTVETSQLNRPKGLAKFNNNLLVCDQQSSTLKQLNGNSGDLEIIAGQMPGFCDGKPQHTRFDRLSSACVSSIDNVVYICDQYNHLMRYFHNNQFQTLCGGQKPGYTDKIDELNGVALFNSPTKVISLKSGNLLVCDTGNNALRHIHVGARLVTTIIGTTNSPQNQYYHHCTDFKFNPNYDHRSIDREDHYHIFCKYYNKKSNINDLSQYFKRPMCAVQLQDQSVLVGCATGEVWWINNRFDDMQLLKNLSVGQLTELVLDTQNSNILYGVDYQYHCVWRFEIQKTFVDESKIISSHVEGNMSKTAKYATSLQNQYQLELLKRSTQPLARTVKNQLHQTNNLNATNPTSYSHNIDFEQFLRLLVEIPDNNESQIGNLTRASQAEVNLLRLPPQKQQMLIILLMSLTAPGDQQQFALQSLRQFFVFKLLNNYNFSGIKQLTKSIVLKGIAMQSFMAVSLQISDADDSESFHVQKTSFAGGFSELLALKINVVVGDWLGPVYQNLFLVVKVNNNAIMEQPLQELQKSQFGDMTYTNDNLLLFRARIDVRPGVDEVFYQGEDGVYNGALVIEIIDRDTQSEVQKAWICGKEPITFDVKMQNTENIVKKEMGDVVAFWYL